MLNYSRRSTPSRCLSCVFTKRIESLRSAIESTKFSIESRRDLPRSNNDENKVWFMCRLWNYAMIVVDRCENKSLWFLPSFSAHCKMQSTIIASGKHNSWWSSLKWCLVSLLTGERQKKLSWEFWTSNFSYFCRTKIKSQRRVILNCVMLILQCLRIVTIIKLLFFSLNVKREKSIFEIYYLRVVSDLIISAWCVEEISLHLRELRTRSLWYFHTQFLGKRNGYLCTQKSNKM